MMLLNVGVLALSVYLILHTIVPAVSDRIKEADVERVLAETTEQVRKRPAAHPDILATSSEKWVGIDAVRDAIEQLHAAEQ